MFMFLWFNFIILDYHPRNITNHRNRILQVKIPFVKLENTYEGHLEIY